MSKAERHVGIVTDSTADIPPQLRDELDIHVVPLRINFGQESFRDGVDLSTDEFMERLTTAKALPTTSQPTASEFAAVFDTVNANGQDVVCVTLGERLSGTYQAAMTAAEQSDLSRITVIDGGSTTMQLGWPVVVGARLAQRGASRDEVVAAINEAMARVNLFAVLKTLDYVYKGGRIGRVGQLVGSALGIKPILSFRDGTLVPLERIRTWNRALRRMIQLVEDEGDLSDIIVMYTDNQEDADTLLHELRERHPSANVMLGYAGAVISTHAGPGAIGIATLKRS